MLRVTPNASRELWNQWVSIGLEAQAPREILADFPGQADVEGYAQDIHWLLERLEAGEGSALTVAARKTGASKEPHGAGTASFTGASRDGCHFFLEEAILVRGLLLFLDFHRS